MCSFSGNENEVVAANKPRKKTPRGRNVSRATTEPALVETTTQRRKQVTTASPKRKPAKKEGTSTTPAPPTTPDPGSGTYCFTKLISI